MKKIPFITSSRLGSRWWIRSYGLSIICFLSSTSTHNNWTNMLCSQTIAAHKSCHRLLSLKLCDSWGLWWSNSVEKLTTEHLLRRFEIQIPFSFSPVDFQFFFDYSKIRDSYYGPVDSSLLHISWCMTSVVCWSMDARHSSLWLPPHVHYKGWVSIGHLEKSMVL